MVVVVWAETVGSGVEALDGSVLDASVLAGAVLDGAVLDGAVLDGAVLDGSAAVVLGDGGVADVVAFGATGGAGGAGVGGLGVVIGDSVLPEGRR